MLKGKRREMLSAIAQTPRTPYHFTHGSTRGPMRPDIVQMYLDEMTENGYLYEDCGVYAITAKGRQELDTVLTVASPRRFISTETYVPKNMEAVRPGADDHKQYLSKGF